MKKAFRYIFIFYFVFTGISDLYASANDCGLIIYFNNNMHSDSTLFPKLSLQLIKKIEASSVIQNLNADTITCGTLHAALSPEDFYPVIKYSEKTRYYLILGSINTFNQLVYVTASIYLIYQKKPLKYLNLFDLKTKYYHPTLPPNIKLYDRILPELLLQIKTGLDDKIEVVFKSVVTDSTRRRFSFLKDAVPEYLKSRLVISEKIKVHRDTIVTRIEGVTQKPQYIVDSFVFSDRNQIHVLVNCIDYNEDQIIISKQISFNIQNPDNLETMLYKIGDDFRNAILNLYNSKIHNRKISIAVVARPPFFSGMEDPDEEGMKITCKNIISSFISSFRTDSILKSKFEFVRGADYFSKISDYLNKNQELSVITTDLNAEILIVLQTIGNPGDFDLNIEKYTSRSVNESEQIKYLSSMSFIKIKRNLDNIYCLIRKKLLDTVNVSCNNIKDLKKPSEFYKEISGKLGLRIMGLQSFNKGSKNLFLGNYLRPAFEVAAYYSFAAFSLPISFEISFIYDFGKTRNYVFYGEDAVGTVYSRNLNIIAKLHWPFYSRVKHYWSPYFGTGLTLIDVHRTSTNQLGGSFEPGLFLELGIEYSLNYNIFIDLNARFLYSGHNFTTLNEYHDTEIMGGPYQVLYIGAGFGYEF